MKKTLALLIFLLPGFLTGFGQTANTPRADKSVTFRFRSGGDMFILKGNRAELERLCSLIDDYRAEIAEGTMPVCVDGYCASLPTTKENLHTAFVRANRVKSELITRKGLKEADFITHNYATACDAPDGKSYRDLVVVTLRIPAKAEPAAEPQPETVMEQPAAPEPVVEPAPQETPQREPVTPEPVAEIAPLYKFAVRTNVLYDAFLLPTLGVEWRVNRDWSVRLDGSLSWWGDEHGKVQKMWVLSPEVRRYLLCDKRFYVGLSGNYGEYNLYKYALGGLLSKDTGYQGSLWNAGAVVGYQLRLSCSFSVDFNLGLGYTRYEYDNFGVTDGVRVYKERGKTKNFWGPTQAGISLVWTIGGNK